MPEEGICEVKFKNRRTNAVRLLPNGFQERKLRKLADTSAKLFNELNYERRQQFFQRQRVDFRGTWDKYYKKYKSALGVNAQAVLQKNNEAWSSFFSLLKLRKGNRPQPFMKRVNPPKYWKDGESGGRKLILAVRQDRYAVDEQNHKLILKDFSMEIRFAGRLTIYMGYPFNIAQDRGNKFTANMRSYRKLMDVIELKAQEYGMKVFEVVEYGTSRYCAYHDVKVERHPRGVVSCPEGHKLHSDLNSALNILKKATGMVIPTIEKPLSFIVEHSGVAPARGCNP